jgi:hypothetical protein
MYCRSETLFLTIGNRLDLITSTPLARIGVDNPNIAGWNQIANDVECGTSELLVHLFPLRCSPPSPLSAANDQQLACMRAVDSHALEQAVISRDTSFYPIVDGTLANASEAVPTHST